MRVVVQRVSKASVSIDGEVYSSIDNGLLILVGIEEPDTSADAQWLSAKIVNQRIFSDEAGLMNLSVKDTGGSILLVSQFTLFASTKKGNRPSFMRAGKPDMSNALYEEFADLLSNELGRSVATGKFGAMMEVSLINDGPVTIWMDTKNKE